MKYIITITIIILILLSLNKNEEKTMTLTENSTILAFGDSITDGFSASKEESYPYLLSKLTDLQVINAGVNGDTSADGLKRLSELLEDSSIKLMILCFGGNDIIQKKSMSELKNNLKTIIQKAKAKNIDVLLVSVPNISLFGLSPLELYEEIADEEDIYLLSGLIADILSQPSLKSDHIHPNALGYKKMADEIYEALKKNGLLTD